MSSTYEIAIASLESILDVDTVQQLLMYVGSNVITIEMIVAFRAAVGDEVFVMLIFRQDIIHRLHDDNFILVMKLYRDILGSARFITLMSFESVASQLSDDNFIAKLEEYRAILGNAKFGRFISCNAVTSRLNDDNYIEILLHSFFE